MGIRHIFAWVVVGDLCAPLPTQNVGYRAYLSDLNIPVRTGFTARIIRALLLKDFSRFSQVSAFVSRISRSLTSAPVREERSSWLPSSRSKDYWGRVFPRTSRDRTTIHQEIQECETRMQVHRIRVLRFHQLSIAVRVGGGRGCGVSIGRRYGRNGIY
jgi:hypothetical protein